MIIRNNLNLNGKFTFKVFDKNGLIKSEHSQPNFITSIGLEYAKTYSLADCFRYVSLGSGVLPNTATGNNIGTTGLSLPISKFLYIGGNRNHGSCIERESDYVDNGCGTVFNNSGVTLTRTWRVPTGTDTFFTTPFTFKEYQISPGRPAITGWIDDVTTGTVCTCDAGIYTSLDFDTVVYGKESSDFALKYTNICNDISAFTRIIKDISVQTDDYLHITYSLDVNFQTGANKFQIAVNRNNPFPDSEFYNWVISSGASSIIHPGIALINNGDVTSVNFVNQINDSFEFRAGESYYPPLGISLELSCPKENIASYLSNDNLQFRVNEVLGGAASKVFVIAPSGLIGYHKNWVSDVSSSNSSLGDNVLNLAWTNKPRSETTSLFLDAYPDQTNYENSTDYSNIDNGNFTPTTIEPKVIDSNFDASLPFTGRSRAKVVSLQFKEPALSEDLPIRAFIYGYKSDLSDSWFPNVDTLFFATGGAQLTTPINLPSKTYSNPYNALVSNNSVGYYYMDENNILQIQSRITYTANCPAGVSGC